MDKPGQSEGDKSFSLKIPLNSETPEFEDQATEDNDKTKETDLIIPAGSSTTRCKRADFFKKDNNFSKTQVLRQPRMIYKYSLDSVDKFAFKIKKRNNFKTYPRSCLKEK